MRDLITVGDLPIDLAVLISHVASPSAGATVLFVGTVRDHAPGREGVTRLEYEAYAQHVVSKIADIVAEARDRWSIIGVAAVHRTGDLAVGEVSVAVAVSSAHRGDAFPAASFVIDELKQRAPIWKKEHWPGGAEWVQGA
ncbi:MAG: molybdenum cofactor biosynthesis protein MoaE [Actinobacteria bacterium]|nr:MAG: molybdenum cofactor biosynthesis protein MoaE [Actinomycetota bacterium]